MTPEPQELIDLRLAVSRSFEMRELPDYTYTLPNGKVKRVKHKGRQWRADPALVDQLVEAEKAWTHELWLRRQERDDDSTGDASAD